MRDARQRDGPLWVFGYGSLVWRPDFPHVERRWGSIEGWARRFWQGSTDHRGVPEAPGRVVTLVSEAGAICWGTAFRVPETLRERVLARLDHRERGGFERREIEVRLRDDATRSVRAVMYLATPENPNYLGPAPLESIADQVLRSHGPSGSNVEYVERLAASLGEVDARDAHVHALAALLGRKLQRTS